MESAVGQFLERLFQPIALGFTFLLCAGVSDQLSGRGDVDVAQTAKFWQTFAAQALPQESNVLAIIAPFLILFLMGQFASVVGQIIFGLIINRGFSCLSGKDKCAEANKHPSFFALVFQIDDDTVRARYASIGFQVDLLCGIAGVGLIFTLLVIALIFWGIWPNFMWKALIVSLPLFVISLFVAIFHALEFRSRLREVIRIKEGCA